MPETLERIIVDHPFFGNMASEHIELITECAKNVRFEPGHMIFREGDEAHEFYCIREGLIAVGFIASHRGFTTIQTVGEGDVLGWSWLVAPYRWHFAAQTRQTTHALAFDAKCLRAKCEENHNLGYELLKRFAHIVTDRLDATRLQLLDLYGVKN